MRYAAAAAAAAAGGSGGGAAAVRKVEGEIRDETKLGLMGDYMLAVPCSRWSG